MLNKVIRRNVLPATSCLATSTTTATAQKDWVGRGLRLHITIASVTAGGGVDKIFLCATPAAGGNPVPFVGFSGANILATVGTFFADFYPGAWLPPTIAAGGNLLGAAGIHVPLNWSAQVIMGAGNAATITIDAEMLP